MITIILGEDNTQMLEVWRTYEGTHYFPEQTLHPVHIVKTIVPDMVEEHLSGTDVVVCTHSQTIIDYIGDMIDEGKLTHKDVIIKIVEGGFIQNCGYDEDGNITNWEFGFFSGARL